MTGYKRTSVHLPADLAERVDSAAASGVPLRELIRRGLDAEGAGVPERNEDMVRRVVREELAEALKTLQPAPAPSGERSHGTEDGNGSRARAKPPARPAAKSRQRASGVDAATRALASGDIRGAARRLRDVSAPEMKFREPQS